ncbi:MAG: hypothetical protein NTX63_01655 [Candidatus Peregrinibacteria bacterium]|nr:hypothetical protein [Candidatus Peregrinibacteria bacterium]
MTEGNNVRIVSTLEIDSLTQRELPVPVNEIRKNDRDASEYDTDGLNAWRDLAMETRDMLLGGASIDEIKDLVRNERRGHGPYRENYRPMPSKDGVVRPEIVSKRMKSPIPFVGQLDERNGRRLEGAKAPSINQLGRMAEVVFQDESVQSALNHVAGEIQDVLSLHGGLKRGQYYKGSFYSGWGDHISYRSPIDKKQEEVDKVVGIPDGQGWSLLRYHWHHSDYIGSTRHNSGYDRFQWTNRVTGFELGLHVDWHTNKESPRIDGLNIRPLLESTEAYTNLYQGYYKKSTPGQAISRVGEYKAVEVDEGYLRYQDDGTWRKRSVEKQA